jgi:hypothetical protein
VPERIVVFGPADAWQDAKQRSAELGIKPRKGAVRALESMMTASPGWFIRDDDGKCTPGSDRQGQLEAARGQNDPRHDRRVDRLAVADRAVAIGIL